MGGPGTEAPLATDQGRTQVLRRTRIERVRTIAVIAVTVVGAVAVAALLGVVLWRVLDTYIDPTSPTQKKDLVQSFAVVVAGAVGSLSALAAVGNLYVSRRNLQQQRELDMERAERERAFEHERAQEDAVPEYIEQMSRLLRDKEMPLRKSQEGDEVRSLARARTLAALARLDGFRKVWILEFLFEMGLIQTAPPHREKPIVSLRFADLRETPLANRRLLAGTDLDRATLDKADLTGANLRNANLPKARLIGADLTGVFLRNANLSGAVLSGAVLSGAYLTGADLSGADLSGADLSDTREWTEDQLLAARSLSGATMPDGQKYEDWIKDKEGSGKDVENE